MPAIKIMGFDGLVPRMSATMLSDNQAQVANNVKLYSQELRFWRGPTAQTATMVANTKSIFKYYAAAADPYWLVWASDDIDVVASPTTDLTDYRLYYTGDGVPKKTNESLVSTGSGAYPRGWLNMGVPAPTGAPTVSASGGSGTAENRAYVYTYVSTFGSIKEESAPSPAATVSVLPGGTVTVNAFTTAPTTNYNITHRRIYRSVTGATTDSYQFVAEIPIGTTSYADSLTAAQLGEVLGTIGWTPPPSTLRGLIALPGGALAGFDGNTVYFSEPFYPHAWPVKYALNVPSKIVGLGVFGTSIAVMTDRYPYIINGGIPGAMSVERVPSLEPCLTKRSIISNEAGVMYASPNGLMQIGPNSVGIQTGALFRRDEWQAYSPSYIFAVSYDNKYFALYSNAVTSSSSFILSGDDIPALSKISLRATGAHIDSRNGYLYYVGTDNVIYQADADDLNPLLYTWKSKRFVLPQATSFSALKLDGDFDQADLVAAYNAEIAAIKTANQAIFGTALNGALNTTAVNFYDVNGSKLKNIPPPAMVREAQVLIYGDGTLQTTLSVSTFDPVRIPPFKSRTVELQISGNISVRSVAVATTVMELHQ